MLGTSGHGEGDPEDDESREEPELHAGDAEQKCSGNRELTALRWEDIGELTNDPRSSTGSIPEDPQTSISYGQLQGR